MDHVEIHTVNHESTGQGKVRNKELVTTRKAGDTQHFFESVNINIGGLK